MDKQTIARMPDAIKKTGLSRSTIYNLMAEGKFVRKIKLSQRSIGFLESDIDQWINRQVEKSTQGES